MKEKLRLLLRKPAVIALLIAELLVIGFALAAALRPAAAYTFTADQWESIAQESEIGYDEDGRIGVTEMTDGEDILQTPAMTLPKGHYKVRWITATCPACGRAVSSAAPACILLRMMRVPLPGKSPASM